MHTTACAHAVSPSCLRAADTNKGCSRFDSTRQAAAAQQGRPFTACQPTLLQEAPTKSRTMWDSHKRDDGDTVPSNLRHAGTHKKTDTHAHPCHPLSPPVLLPACSGTAAGLSHCQSHWWDCSAMSKFCVLPSSRVPQNSVFNLSQLEELFQQQQTKSHEVNEEFSTLYTVRR